MLTSLLNKGDNTLAPQMSSPETYTHSQYNIHGAAGANVDEQPGVLV